MWSRLTHMTAAVSASLRQRIVEAAVGLTTEVGWSQVTMAKLADRVGVSRQTVYNEIGTKPALAEAMILTELDRFLQVVSAAFDRHPDDLVGAIRAASREVLELAQDNRLLHAVVSATHGADTELLPLLTTHAESLLAAAKLVVADKVAPYDVQVGRRAPRGRHRHGGPGGAQPRDAAVGQSRRDRRRHRLDLGAGAARLTVSARGRWRRATRASSTASWNALRT